MAFVAVMVSSWPAMAEDNLLATFEGVSTVVLTSSHPDISEVHLREIVEGRLRKNHLLLDGQPELGGRLTVQIASDHNNSGPGCSYTSYDVRLTVTEPATLDRSPGSRVLAVMWQRAMRVSVLGHQPEVPSNEVIDKVNDLTNAFVAAVASARQGAK